VLLELNGIDRVGAFRRRSQSLAYSYAQPAEDGVDLSALNDYVKAGRLSAAEVRQAAADAKHPQLGRQVQPRATNVRLTNV
jgi:hypothetical protein